MTASVVLFFILSFIFPTVHSGIHHGFSHFLLTLEIQNQGCGLIKKIKIENCFPRKKKTCTQNLKNICANTNKGLWQSHCKEFSCTVFSCLKACWGFFKCLLHCSYSSSGNFKEQGDFIATECSAVYAPEQSKRNFWIPIVSSFYLHLLVILHKIKWD